MASKFALARNLGRLSLAEKALLLFCEHPANVPGYEGHDEAATPIGNPLFRLQECFPQLDSLIAGKRVLDFGCGTGAQSLALATLGAAEVLGVDINEKLIWRARISAPANVAFATKADGEFDTIVCQDAFEHLSEPEGCLREMLRHLKPEGRILLTFGPLWLSPYGAHCHYFTQLPWVHLLFSERTVHRVMGLYRRNPGTSYSEEMNKMTVAKFWRIVRSVGCRVDNIQLDCVKGLNFLAAIPGLNELFVREISCEITKS
jgi:SAM-dependent methyltransferase